MKWRKKALIVLSILATSRARADNWPDLSQPARTVGGGEHDAAVIVGAENYAFVAKVPGARRNADDWQTYLTDTLRVPSDRISLLRDNEATLEKMRHYASLAAAQVQEGGTLWFVFIGHGAPSADGKDGLLVGTDAQQDPDGLYARSLPRNELLSLLSRGKQAKAVVLIDACFSGRSSSGETLIAGLQPLVVMGQGLIRADPRIVLLTAAKSDQFAGPLPRAAQMRPAFSYLALGALRGWAADAQGKVKASAVIDFARRALALEKGRTQTPELTAGAAGTVLGQGSEVAPNLSKIDRAETSDLTVTDVWFFSGKGERGIDAAKASASRASSRTVAAGDNFGVGVKFSSSQEKIKVRIEMHVPHSPEKFPSHAGKVSMGPDGKTVFVDYEIPGSRGRFAHYWGYGAGDPVGRYEVKIYVEGILTGAYAFNTELRHAENDIDANNANARNSLRLGMTRAQVTAILGSKNMRAGGSPFSDSCSITGTHFLVFDGDVLMKVVPLGSLEPNGGGTIVNDCSDAVANGGSVVR